ncbi:MAG TPA: squalene--hopene cyclase [Candidatus Dormibacteraeota bacterium]
MASEALTAAVDWILERQNPEGWWTAELETNVTMTAEHVLLLRFLRIPLDDIAERAVAHMLGCQRQDGTWGLYHNAPGDLSTTLEAYVALRVLGVDAGRTEMRRALHFIRNQGGITEARVFTKIWMALFGAYPWRGVPTLPPELIAFPPQLPFNLYDFACWARQTVAPLLLVCSRRPVRDLGVEVGEIVAPGTEHRMRRVPGSGPFWWLDQGLRMYHAQPLHPGRPQARRALVNWISDRQEADGSWGGIQPPWVYSLMALEVEGVPRDNPVFRRGIEGLQSFAFEDGSGWRFQACVSPVWDTAWTLLALRRAGIRRDHPAIRTCVEWLLNEQIEHWGDWQVKVPLESCGGWAFEFENDVYPDIDDTAIVILALLEASRESRVLSAVTRGARWCRAMRSSNGAWGAFDKDNTRTLLYKLPFADFGALIDPPSEDCTAHVIEMLAAIGSRADDPDVAPALAYLRAEQRPWGSWFGRWGVNHVYGTWCVVNALRALHTGDDMVRRGARWLERRQNPDSGWGDTCHSYVDESFAGVGDSTASQTAWAVHTLQLAGRGDRDAAQRGLAYLRETQRDGTWVEPTFSGTGFPGDFYLNYHLYRHVFPLLTLATAETAAQTPANRARPVADSRELTEVTH